ncbi:MAG: DNA polymerase/3'-5' exonuclease PolX [Thermoplasmata archaeon]|nr:DNA polymerase/3'-5' exonuclease PolX [Thermoplasmata archaeon]
MENSEVARVFYEIADYLELQGVPFKPKAYRRAAANIEGLDGSIEDFLKKGELNEIPGIGEAIAEKIRELIETGKLEYLDKLRAELPKGLLDLLEIPEVGPKTAMILYKELGIKSVDDLKAAIFDHKLQGIKGFGPKTEEKILQGIRIVESRAGRSLLNDAYQTAAQVLSYLQEKHPGQMMSIAGSLRRMKETIGDIDILVASEEPGKIMDSFVSIKGADEIIAKGDTKSSIRLKNGIQVDIRVVSRESYGAALQYFTGSKEHNVELRKLAISKGMKISEYGLFERKTEKKLTGDDEKEIYRMLDLQFIPPELREARGEMDAAANYRLPELVAYDDLKGDLHCHSEWSDASGTIEDLRDKAEELNYEYVAVTDHSQSLKIAAGLSEERLADQVKNIRTLREQQERPWVFAGSEVDILKDGRLDYPKDVLRELDFAVISVHSRFKMDEKEMTKRIVTAMSNEKAKILAHPTGRIIGQRTSYEFDFEKVAEAAKSNGIAFEINSFPERLDLNDINVRKAIDYGSTIAINSDAHDPSQLEYTRFGIATARRGWARRSDILNALPLDELMKRFGLK